MFTKFEIGRFGSFHNYAWSASVGANEKLRYLNLIYGRNYSGKTTLSRVFRSLEEQSLPPKYADGRFTLFLDDGSQITESNLLENKQLVRVYNRDFARENLGFLTNESTGEIRPFAVVGADNNNLEEQIRVKQDELGADDQHGLRAAIAAATSNFMQAEHAAKSARNALDDKLRNHAINIKNNRAFGKPVYTIDSIRKDIAHIKSTNAVSLTQSQITDLGTLLKEEALRPIPPLEEFSRDFSAMSSKWSALLQRTITPSKPIQDLLSDPNLQSWVRTGIPLHQHKRTTCGFCGNNLPKELWMALQAHFNQESLDFETSLTRAINEVDDEIAYAKSWLKLTENMFYASFKHPFEKAKEMYEAAIGVRIKNLELFREALTTRAKNVFLPQPLPTVIDEGAGLANSIAAIRKVIASSDAKTSSLAKDQEDARDRLRIDSVLAFITAVSYDTLLSEVGALTEAANDAKNAISPLQRKAEELTQLISSLRSKQSDETVAASKVNDLLHKQFGHGGLRLIAQENAEKAVIFSVMRGDDYAFNLSEGECSLISFCYFLAKLEDVHTKGRKPIVYIDDPISSLDSNHIFFLFSLIEENITASGAAVGAPYSPKFEQIFISTHSLDFFKYLRRLSHPKEGSQLFIMERGKGASQLKLMPKYMKKHQTEFNYLFHQIYLCQEEPVSDEDHDRFYSFGNNLRKFLEALLFYKYPYHGEEHAVRLRRYFGADASAVAVTTRVGNELSHLEEIFDRGMRPMDVPEIPALAKFVILKIKENDPDQHGALLKSVGALVSENG